MFPRTHISTRRYLSDTAACEEFSALFSGIYFRELDSEYRGASLIILPPLGPYSSICLGPYGVPRGGCHFL